MNEKFIFTEFAKFQDKQLQAWYTIMDPMSKYILYGGAAGGGKSYFLRWCAIGLAMYYYAKYGVERVPIGLFSEDYPTLRDRQITKIVREMPDWLGTLRETQRDGLAYYLAPKYGGGVIMFRNLDDPRKYASVEFASILVEELTKNDETTFEDLRTRLRFPGIEDRKFIGATNPGSIGHEWVKRMWITRDFEPSDLEPERYFFIPATVHDNKHNPADYILQLQSIKDPMKRAALLDGSWDSFEGQYFPEWRNHLHKTLPFFPSYPALLVGGMDWGRSSRPSHKTAFYFAIDVIEKVFYNDISFHRCKTMLEVAGKEKTPKEWSIEIKKRLREFGLTLENLAWVRADPAMFAKLQDMSMSIADQFIEEDPRWAAILQPANNDRIAGWEQLHSWLSLAPDGLPYWQVAENCEHIIRTLPNLPRDEVRVEDLDTQAEDHPADGQRYMKKHIRWIDGSAGAVLTDQLSSTKKLDIIVKDGKQQGLDLAPFERVSTPGNTRVIGG